MIAAVRSAPDDPDDQRVRSQLKGPREKKRDADPFDLDEANRIIEAAEGSEHAFVTRSVRWNYGHCFRRFHHVN